MKVENDKLLEQMKKQEKVADIATISYSMSPPAVEGCSQYENLKLSRWAEEMEEMDKALYWKRMLTSNSWKEKTHTETQVDLT